MSSKQKYLQFCAQTPAIPLFFNEWWLDATVGNANWDVATVEQAGETVAAMPYTITRAGRYTFIGQPSMTQSLGPWISPMPGAHSKILSLQKKAMDSLIEQLPRFDHFSQCWHYSLQNWLPFYWQGFTQTTRYTYIIALEKTLDPMTAFSPNMRNKVRKARRSVTINDNLSVEDFYSVTKKTFARQNVKPPYSLALLQRVDTALSARNQRKIFAGIDSDGNVHSALYLIWDRQSSYVHMAGEDPRFRSSGAGILLIDAAIRFSIDAGLNTFDFEGSMLENVEIVRRSCGGIQTPYFHIRKTPSRRIRARQLVSLIRRRQ